MAVADIRLAQLRRLNEALAEIRERRSEAERLATFYLDQSLLLEEAENDHVEQIRRIEEAMFGEEVR